MNSDCVRGKRSSNSSMEVLVSHLRPDLMLDVTSVDGLLGADRFRTAVAPVYLRRNQSDVLEELPPRLDTQEWVELKGRDLDAYADAVATGNFMAMRRAAYAPARPADSAKLGRPVEIVEEAASNGRKVVVFSYFRDVLDTVAAVLGDLTVGPLTGSTPPIHRQAMIDQFTARQGPVRSTWAGPTQPGTTPGECSPCPWTPGRSGSVGRPTSMRSVTCRAHTPREATWLSAFPCPTASPTPRQLPAR
ncbi:MAG: hypothetical protein ABSA53_25400 [Streptosporangiaceae bacterium]